MAQQFSKTDQRRITFLSLLSSAVTLMAGGALESPYAQASEWLASMEDDGFFEVERPTPARTNGQNRTSGRSASPSRPSNRGRNGGNTPYSGQPLRDPDGPPSEAQVNTILKLTDDYSFDEAWRLTKQQASDLISDLKG